ncbi:MAG TPA: hypothetical protein VD993_04775 [Chitinophagaceae bacterium]|nr:hypothetical protein [Chitinophagaceae bacterium]
MKNEITPNITTYEDLLQEESRLKQKLTLQKAELRHHFHVLTDKLSPVERIAGIVKNFTTPSTRNPFINTGINFAIDMLLRKFYLAKVGWIPKLIVPFVLKNVSSNLVNKKGKSLFKSFKSMFSRNGKVKQH